MDNMEEEDATLAIRLQGGDFAKQNQLRNAALCHNAWQPLVEPFKKEPMKGGASASC
jgi:hypothetical protein